jgi:Protein of unknown function (DUF2569)
MTNSAITLHTEPRGIGGWLILPMLGTIVSPLFALLAIVETIPAFENELPSGLQAFVIGEILFNFGLMVGWIVAAVRLFKHKRSFPSLFITMLVVSFVGSLVDAGIATSVYGTQLGTDDYRTLVRGLVSLLIWAPYMAKSKRVRNTFVES